MKINYKFNKDSEARTCNVDSIELIVKTEATYKELSFEEVIEVLKNDSEFTDDIEELTKTTDLIELVSLLDTKGYDYDFWLDGRDLEKAYEWGIGTMKFGDTGHFEFELTRSYDYTEVEYVSAFIQDKSVTKEAKTFTCPNELKEYINSLEGKIKFVGKSSIDDVLIKEWLGEWEEYEVFNRDYKEEYDIGYNSDLVYLNIDDLSFYRKPIEVLLTDEDIIEINKLITDMNLHYPYKDFHIEELTNSYYCEIVIRYKDYSTKSIIFDETKEYLTREDLVFYEKIKILKNPKIKLGSPKLNSNWKFKNK